MFRLFSCIYTICFLLISSLSAFSQSSQLSSSEIKQRLEKLNVLGSVLYFAAHPDDENTRLISWLANEKKYRTSYLSLTRGDGGQNLIGNELGIELGLIRTQELLAARAIDGGEQLFSSAYDFGFSKTHEETFRFWNKEETLREAVFIIRKLRPDVIINRFPPDERGGHGHHQASAILSHEAFLAAADPNRFPEQLNQVEVWQAKRLLWNTANFGGANNTSEEQLKIDIGAFNPLLGISYGEMAAKSRSQHKSQGFGALPTRGKSIEYFEHVAGDVATETLFDAIQTDWNRLENSQEIIKLISKLNHEFNASKPQQSIECLSQLHRAVSQIKDNYWKEVKLEEIEGLMLACSGFHVDNYTNLPHFVKGTSFDVFQQIIVRNPDVKVRIVAIDGISLNKNLIPNEVFNNTQKTVFEITTQPYWLQKPYTKGKFDVEEEDFGQAENKYFPRTSIDIEINGIKIIRQIPIKYRYLDPVRGEVQDPLRIIPELTATTSASTILLNKNEKKSFAVTFTNHGNNTSHSIKVNTTKNIHISPSQVDLDFSSESSVTQIFDIEIENNNEDVQAISFAKDQQIIPKYNVISYNHIPTVSWFPDLNIKVQPIDLKSSVNRVAYIDGAGDLVAESLRSIGIQVDVLHEHQLSKTILKQYDAVVFGVRAYNVIANLNYKTPILLDYVKEGGVVLIQYNVNGRISGGQIGPYPFDITRSRVTEEDAVVKFLLPSDPVLQYPNTITSKDFEHWVQERGLYFAENADEKYRKPLSMHDKNEKEHNGALLVSKYGQGKFVYTSLSFFRQLPAGIPGAYRLFVNLLDKESK